MTDPPSVVATRSRLALRLLAPEDAERVHSAALDRLARGVVPAGREVREALLVAGATEADDGALCLASQIVEAAAKRAPSRVALGARTEERDVVLGGGGCLLAAGGLSATMAEPVDAGPARPATLADLEAACRLADALPEVAVVSGPPLRTAPADDLAAQATAIARTLHATGKHVQLTALASPALTAVVADLAAALRDGEGELRRRPPLSLLGGADSFAAAAVFARRGLPAGALVAVPTTRDATGADPAPADVTSTLVAFVADVLAANAAIQALAPGAAFVAPVWPELAGLPATGPAAAAFVAAATQVLARAGLPAAAGAFATSAPAPDWEACTDGSFAVLSAALAGAALASGAGTLRGGAVFSARQLVADAELFSWCATIAAGIEVGDETLAVDTIRQVDICGNYLGQRHTRQHMKDVWRPRLLDRGPFDAWVAGGRQGVAERAAELAGALLAGHAVEPLDAEPAAKLERIIATAGL